MTKSEGRIVIFDWWSQCVMDDTSTTSTTNTKPDDETLTININKRSKVNNKKGGWGGDDDDGDSDCEGYDVAAWNTLSKSFKQVQTVLDDNRSLIERVNENQLSKIPDNMSKNVALIREINGNISKVVSIYSDLSASLSYIVGQRRRRTRINDGHVESSED